MPPRRSGRRLGPSVTPEGRVKRESAAALSEEEEHSDSSSDFEPTPPSVKRARRARAAKKEAQPPQAPPPPPPPPPVALADEAALVVAGLADNANDADEDPMVVDGELVNGEALVVKKFEGSMEPHDDMLMPLLPFQKQFLAWSFEKETADGDVRGGILADEMGMGKTIQTLSLIVTNRPDAPKKRKPVFVDAEPSGYVRQLAPDEIKQKKSSGGRAAAAAAAAANAAASSAPPPLPAATAASLIATPSRVRKSKATLVVCPVVAVIQWRGEIERYLRPGSLKMALYHGPNRHASVDIDELCDQADVVLTTYSTLEVDYRNLMPDKVTCEYCGKKYLADKYRTHLTYFCGPHHVRSAKLMMRQRFGWARGRGGNGGGGAGGGGAGGAGGGKGKGKGKTAAKTKSKGRAATTAKGKKRKTEESSEEDESASEEDDDLPPPPPPPRSAKGRGKAKVQPTKKPQKGKKKTDSSSSDEDWDSDLADSDSSDGSEDDAPDEDAIERDVAKAVALAAKEKRFKATSSKPTGSILHQIHWHRIVLDEAHAIKARQSNTAQAVFDLSATYRWALSGTPLQNRVGELYSIIRYLRTDPFGYYFCKACEKEHKECKSLWSMTDGRCNHCGCAKEAHWCWWNRHVANPIKYHGFAGRGYTAMMTLKNTVLNTCLIRRTKEQCADDLALPPRTVILRRDKLDPREEDFYEALYTQSQSTFDAFVSSGTILHNYAHIFDLLMRLRQAVDHPYLVVHSTSAQATAERHRLKAWAERAVAPGGDGGMGADALEMQEALEEAEAAGDDVAVQPPSPSRIAQGCAVCGGDDPMLELVRTDCCRVAMCMPCALAAAEAPQGRGGLAKCPACSDALEADFTTTFHPTPGSDVGASAGASTPQGTTNRRSLDSRSKLPPVSAVAPAFGREGAKLRAALDDDEEDDEDGGLEPDLEALEAKQASSVLPRTGGGVGALRGKGFDLTSFAVKKNSILSKVDLRNFQTSTKLEALREEIAKMKARDSSAKAIVFSQFTNMLDLILFRLTSTNIRCLKLDGSMSLAQRDKAIEEFTHSPDVDVFLMSLKAGGVALNLTAASHVFLMDPWWNPAVEQQACDRIHRLGQYKPITVVRLVIANTVEERIIKLQEKKSLIFEGTVGGDTEALGKLTEDDLKFLFG